ncbi:MAG: peroxiredoxin [Alphaproteobacteria bacterium]|jgi:peroxiredoxin
MASHNKIRSTLVWFILAACAFAGGLFSYNLLSYDFKTLDEKTYKHSDLEGSIVVVNYFAEWCAPCLREIPELNEFYHQAPDNVKLFAVSFDNLSNEKLKAIQTKYNIEFPLVSEVMNDFSFEKPQYLPATFIIKPNGELAGQLLGEQTTATLNEVISAL